ncbi:helix-turn-helix domain-containing protein [Corynebacterium variabile]|uniref:helix-turn-helix domain-containing protein n=1 Tax=Corynebacterium variabile TaxID=1727 RepID=UPI002647EE2D|nr:helix-turn-helix domain-containing protein [Corynebacterium variabile]MDN6677212.1 helix-turn-helix domain-containing protein [Corynebacterium variabile]
MSDTSAADADWLHRRLQSATQLTELRDTESTLQVVVRHTRGLMDADMAYVSFTDFDSNETVIRKTDGVRTGEYASIRQPLGTGVLGRVAIGHASYWTSDYRTDEKLHHMGPIDEIVEGEGVRALLGAPLSVAGRVIGALLIAFRSPREFSDTEVDRLESLADQAAVAIDNAQRHEQLMALVESDVDHRGERSDTDIAELSRSLDLDRRLVEAVTSELPSSSLLAIGAQALGCDLWLTDLTGTRRLASSTDRTLPDRTDGTFVTVTAAGQQFGHLLTDRSLNEAEQAVLERVSLHVALWMMLTRAREAVELRDGTEAVSALIDGTLDAAGARSVLEEWWLHQVERWCVLVLETPDPVVDRVVRALSASSPSPVIVAPHEGHICVITGDARWVDALPSLFAPRGWTLRGGMTRVDAPTDLPDAHRTAELALSAQVTLGRTGLSDGTGLGVVAAVLHLGASGGLPTSLIADLTPLTSYDSSHHSDLLRTADVYFSADGNVARTATVLGVHRNTVRQRLDRIGELMGEDWNRMPRKLDLQLALRVHAVAPRGGGPSDRQA